MTEFLDLYYQFNKTPTDPTVAKLFIAKLAEQESELEFPSFTAEDALAMGLLILSESPNGKNQDLPEVDKVVVHISVNGNLLFYSAQDGTSAGNLDWIKRKVNTVTKFGHSSLYMGASCLARGLDFNRMMLLPESEYVGAGGGFPLRIKGVTYPVGVIAVSGLPQEDDHELLVRSIRKYLNSKI
ncbi:hypothetical protein V1505DRAFT_423435 [Lipomyces doorenjongii]